MKAWFAAAWIAVLALGLLWTTAEAQRPGRNARRGFGVVRYGVGNRGGGIMGRGYGYGGWWNRGQAATPEQRELVAKVADLHEQIRMKYIEISALRMGNAPAQEIADAEGAVNRLRSELAALTQANERIIRDMGVPQPYGICDGSGRGRGMRAVGGWGGRGGRGRGLRDGTGPNPYCPLKP